MADCIFCNIISEKFKSEKLGETDKAIAIADIQPQAPTHLLILPKKHIASLNDISKEDRKEVIPHLYELADKLMDEKGLKKRGYRTVINNQAEGGQTVFHLHMHVLAGEQLRGSFGS